MMEILSYPVGLLIGLFPIAVDLGPTRDPAHLLLDSRPVCEMTARSPGCMVDLGQDPRVHLLELVRTDAAGHVTERVRRWINRPGIEPEVLAAGGCDEKGKACTFDLSWAHPRKLDPKRLALTLDGATVYRGTERRVKVSLSKGAKPQVLVVDAEFPDGTRATYTRTLYAFYPEEAQAALQAVPVFGADGPGAETAAGETLRQAGWPVRIVEDTEPEIVFVVEPRAFEAIPSLTGKAFVGNAYSDFSRTFTSISVVVANESLTMFNASASRRGWIGALLLPPSSPARWRRFADAVAAAGYALGGSPKCRAVVLVIGNDLLVEADRPDMSTFSPAQAQTYLAEAMVPLIVWRVGQSVAPEWPEGRRLSTAEDFGAALAALQSEVTRQRIAWFEGSRDTRHIGRDLAPGIALAGRSAPRFPPPRSSGESEAPVAERSIGPDGGPVHAVAASADGAVVYAGTHAAAFLSRDRGAHWEATGAGLPMAPVRALAVDPARGETVYAGTDAGLFRSEDGGQRWQSVGGSPATAAIASLSFDPTQPGVLYAGTRGFGIFRSDDRGSTFSPTALLHGDVRAIATDPRGGTVAAATEEGVLRSVDRGATWTPDARLPARALALLWSGGKLYAGTAGQGLLVSAGPGDSWRRTKLSGAFLTGLATDAGPPGLFLAASTDGVFFSADGGASWKLARSGAVESLASVGPGTTLAAGSRGVSRGENAGHRWSASNTGLTAHVVHSVASAAGSPGAIYAGTESGLYRLNAGKEGWSAVAGTPEAPTYTVALGGTSEPDLLVGASGDIGRSFEDGASWSWFPTHSAFSLAVDPARPSVAYAGTRGAVLKSEDGGLGWRESSEGIVKTFALSLALDARDPAVVYAGTAGSGVYRSANGGKSWKPGGGELSRAIVRCLAVEPNAADTLHAGTDRGVFTSSDTGRTWKPGFAGLPRGPVYALLVDAESPLTVFAGTSAGLFLSLDGGRSWGPFPASRLPAAVTSLALDRSGDALVAGTLGAGVFLVPLR